jgi:hypothetical protein
MKRSIFPLVADIVVVADLALQWPVADEGIQHDMSTHGPSRRSRDAPARWSTYRNLLRKPEARSGQGTLRLAARGSPYVSHLSSQRVHVGATTTAD